MADPGAEFKALLEAADLPSGTNLYPAPTPTIEPPAIVLRPNTPWMEPSTFCLELERYSAIAVVQASTPADGIATLRLLTLAIIGALQPPWDWETVDGPVIDESTGKPFLANRVNLTYKAVGG